MCVRDFRTSTVHLFQLCRTVGQFTLSRDWQLYMYSVCIEIQKLGGEPEQFTN